MDHIQIMNKIVCESLMMLNENYCGKKYSVGVTHDIRNNVSTMYVLLTSNRKKAWLDVSKNNVELARSWQDIIDNRLCVLRSKIEEMNK